jgi:transposase
MEADTLIGDKAFDADARVLEPLADAGKTAVIPPRSNRSPPRDYDRHLYGERHLIENFFAKIKQFRAIATRYEKIARNFLAAVRLVACIVWLNPKSGSCRIALLWRIVGTVGDEAIPVGAFASPCG